MDFISELKQTFTSGKTKSLEWRQSQLLALKQMLEENEKAIYKALRNDLGKCEFESHVSEYGFVLKDIILFLKKTKLWAKTRTVNTPLLLQPGKSTITPEPLGTVLIMGAWNYPLQLVLSPMVAALAAGNCVVLKPSELASATSNLLAKLIPKYLDSKGVAVYEGGIEETTELLKQRFDHIMYTGSEAVGKIVMRAASEYLTPVTLELGGKSPCIVDDQTNLKVTANRIVWGKFLNAGQTCIAPDYILVTAQQREPLIKALQQALIKQYGHDPKESPDYGRIVNERHFKRITGYLKNQEDNLILGGQTDAEQKYIAPTLVFGPELTSPIMTEEIFGPVLPIIEVASMDKAVQFINEREKPLALYLFSDNDLTIKMVTKETSSGTLSINDTVAFMLNAEFPFGGVGSSGMGSYHGKWGFDTFSHLKPILHKSFFADVPIRYAPYSNWKQKVFKFLAKF
jgi:aldehyde dehydrogenase (NAD+)